RDHPAVALAVGGAMRKQPALQPPGHAPGATGLADDCFDDGLLHGHGLLPAAPQQRPCLSWVAYRVCMRSSQHLQARSKSTAAERLLTIGELARRVGVASSALRYWEDVGLLPAPKRISGQRRYPESAVALGGPTLLLP